MGTILQPEFREAEKPGLFRCGDNAEVRARKAAMARVKVGAEKPGDRELLRKWGIVQVGAVEIADVAPKVPDWSDWS